MSTDPTETTEPFRALAGATSVSTEVTEAKELFRALAGATIIADTSAAPQEREGRLPCMIWPIGVGPVGATDVDTLRAWLENNRITATVEMDGRRDEARIEFADADSGHRLAELMRAPADRAKAMARRLEEALAVHKVDAKVGPAGMGKVAVDIQDITDMPSAKNLARALGAGDIADGLDLNEHDGQYEFGDRMRLLMKRVAGGYTDYDLHTDCRHTPSAIELGFTEGQAQKLIDALTVPAGQQVAP
ncbi:hypothetical protein ABT024_04895 [Streptomyces sp. NPDC002812]|uniref:hypothetical protein n=1 Tax=Streptomyces sp. NPDC002812 TaxID=3154434 RepID=UPI0033221A3B